MFEFFQALTLDDPQKNPLTTCYGFKPMNLSINADMSTTWKGLQRGGGMKKQTYACHCCEINSNDIVNPAESHCDKCLLMHSDRIANGKWQCFHKHMLTPDMMERLDKQLDEILQSKPSDYEKMIEDKSRINNETDPRVATVNSRSDPTSIHFEPSSPTDDAAFDFSDLLDDELLLRGLNPEDLNLTERRELLRGSLLQEYMIKRIRICQELGRPREGSLFLLLQAIPCVLHMENRVGLKILTILLDKGLENAMEGDLFGSSIPTNHERQLFSAYCQRVESIFNTEILGDALNPSQWKLPRDDQKRELTDITFDNNKTRLIVSKLEILLESLLVKSAERDFWRESVTHYRAAMEKLRQQDDFTDEEIMEVQVEVDLFFQSWVSLHGKDGVTNYIHMLGSGHVSEYLIHWRNLYRFTQQGYEAFNSMLKVFFFKRTARGGKAGHNKDLHSILRSRLLPIAKWLQRRTIWMCGYTMQEIEIFLLENEAAIELAMDQAGPPDDEQGSAWI